MRVLLINPYYPISETSSPPLGLAYGFHIVAPFPGTEVRAHADRLGTRILTDDWSRYHANQAVVETAAAGRQQLNTVVSKWEDRYNQYLGHIQKNIQAGKASADEIIPLENLNCYAMGGRVKWQWHDYLKLFYPEPQDARFRPTTPSAF